MPDPKPTADFAAPARRPARAACVWMFRADCGRTGVLGGLILLDGAVTLGVIWGIGRIGLVLVNPSATMWPAWAWLVLIGGLQGLRPLLNVAIRWLGVGIAHCLERLVRERVMDAAGAPLGLAHLETPAGAALFAVASGAAVKTFSPPQIVLATAAWAGTRIQGLAAAAMLGFYAPWAPVLLWAAWSVFPSWIARQTQAQVDANEAATLGLRQADYLRGLALAPEAAHEIRLFGLDRWLGGRFAEERASGLREATARRHRGRWGFIPLLAIPAAATLVVGHGLIAGFHAGTVELAVLVVGMSGLIGALEIGRTMAWWTRAWHGVEVLAALDRLSEAAVGAPPITSGTREAAARPQTAVTFEAVKFAYPGQPQPIYTALNLSITAGTSCAIVGVNGAGKTTLVKLLARLYDPQAGRITVDGVDLGDYDLAGWRRQLAVVSQDFVKYPATLRENVWPGSPVPTPEQWARVCARAGLDELLSRLPAGADTLVARGYEGGVDLSGGQWQRVALARAFAAVERGARLLVLDEPTANLDIRAEAELFARFLELTKGLTTILITHRMASVRHVDRVVVVDGGAVVESGNPGELLARGGRYADLFRLQAERFNGKEAADA